MTVPRGAKTQHNLMLCKERAPRGTKWEVRPAQLIPYTPRGAGGGACASGRGEIMRPVRTAVCRPESEMAVGLLRKVV